MAEEKLTELKVLTDLRRKPTTVEVFWVEPVPGSEWGYFEACLAHTEHKAQGGTFAEALRALADMFDAETAAMLRSVGSQIQQQAIAGEEDEP